MDFEEFCVLMQKKIAQETQSELLELFSIWDEAGKGTIESGELKCLLNRVPVRLTRREIDALVDYADTKKMGKSTLKVRVTLYVSLQRNQKQQLFFNMFPL